MTISKKVLEISFVLMRKCGEKGDNPYLLKAMSDSEIRELYEEAGFPKDEFDSFINEYRKAISKV